MFNYYNMGPIFNCYIDSGTLHVDHFGTDVATYLNDVGRIHQKGLIKDVANTPVTVLPIVWKITDDEGYLYIGRSDGTVNIVKDNYIWGANHWITRKIMIPYQHVGYALIRNVIEPLYLDPIDHLHVYCQFKGVYAELEEPIVGEVDPSDMSAVIKSVKLNKVIGEIDKIRLFVINTGGEPNAGIKELCVASSTKG